MAWPGEQLLGKMWETLAEKGIGNLLKPGQIRREGLASIEMERVKLLASAQAHRDAEEIRLGKREISDFSINLDFKKTSGDHQLAHRIEPSLDYRLAMDVARDQLINDSVRREINVAQAVIFAEETLKHDDSAPSEQSVDDDWLYRWRDSVGDVSVGDLQKLWGRVLAGEVKTPGSYSLRCLEFLKNLTKSEAKLIERLGPLDAQGLIWRPASGQAFPLNFEELIELQSLGIISGVEAMGMNYTFSTADPGLPTFIAALICVDKCLIVRNKNKEAKLPLPIYGITALGRQILSLGEFEADLTYLNRLAQHIISLGFDVAMADGKIENDAVSWISELPIAASPQKMTQ